MAKKSEAGLATETQRRRVEKQTADAGSQKSDSLGASVPLWQKPSSLLDTRVVYCGDNLEQLAKLPDARVDLIYIDPPAWTKPLHRGEGPPFNFNRNYDGGQSGSDFWGETKRVGKFVKSLADAVKSI
jgi:hypothetical protein